MSDFSSAPCFATGHRGFISTPLNLKTGHAPNPTLTYSAWLICTECPLTSQCLTHIDPARSFFSGVAGGLIWGRGRDCTERFLTAYERESDEGL